jgi:hypothetical protein
MIDAKAIATSRNFYSYHLFGSVELTTEIHDSIIFGGNVTDIIDIKDVNVSGTTFDKVHLRGHYFGRINARNCILDQGLIGMDGIFNNCGIAGEIFFDNGVLSDIDDCVSQVPGLDSVKMHFGNDQIVHIRKWSGGIEVYDIQSGTTVDLEYMAGNCQLLSGNTAGEVHVRGISKFLDQSSGTTVVTEGLLVPIDVARQHTLNVNTEVVKNK